MKNIILTLFFACITSLVVAQSTQNALDFDGTDDYVQTTFPAITGTNARTIEAWIKTSANANPSATGTQQIITDMGSFVTGGRFTFNILWGNAIRLEVGGSGLSGQTAVNDGNWHHVACVYDPAATKQISLYVDGVVDTAGNIPTTINTSSGNLQIGRRVDNSRHFEGHIDEVRVWNIAKTATQISALKDEEICANQTGLVAYYRCNEGTANGSNTAVTTLMDNSSSSNNGTLTNFGLNGSSSNWVNGVNITAAPNSDTTLNVDACGSYSTPGGQFVNTSRTVVETITNSVGCDSVITLNITIKSPSFERDTVIACDSFRSAKGTLYTSSRSFIEIFTKIDGCDSIIETTLILGNTTSDTSDIQNCYSYTSPSGTTWSTSGTYTESLNSILGCDSTVVINLTLTDSTLENVVFTSCGPYTSPSNNIYTTSGVYREVQTNSNGCDSITTITLTVNQPSDTLITVQACDSFTTESGLNTLYNSGTIRETLTNQSNCDSLVSYALTVNYATSATLTVVECDPFVSPAGNNITETGIYTDILTNTAGCDSTITIDATVTDNAPMVTKNGVNLEVDLTGLSYQWLICDDNNSRIALANEASYKPTISGNYSVEVSENDCKDTSECINYPRTASVAAVKNLDISLAPNPANGSVKINSDRNYNFVVLNNLGQIVTKGNTANTINTSKLTAGMYYVHVYTKDKTITLPLIVEHTQY